MPYVSVQQQYVLVLLVGFLIYQFNPTLTLQHFALQLYPHIRVKFCLFLLGCM